MAYTAKTAFFADVGVTMFQAGVEDQDKRFEEFSIIGGNGISGAPEIEEKHQSVWPHHNVSGKIHLGHCDVCSNTGPGDS